MNIGQMIILGIGIVTSIVALYLLFATDNKNLSHQ